MHISRFRVINFKSFRDSGDVYLGLGFNVIVGRNNVGKTALVEALSLRASEKPHRSLVTAPTPSSTPDSAYQMQVSFEIDRDEFVGLLGEHSPTFYVPIGENNPTTAHVQRFLEAVGEQNVIETVFQSSQITEACLATYGIKVHTGMTATPALRFYSNNTATGFESRSLQAASAAPGETFAMKLANILRNRVHYFKAERLNLGQASAVYSQVLEPDASNLAPCLHTLQSSNPIRFRRFNELVSEIFPEVRQITVPLTPQGYVRVLVWTVDPISEREDLAVPLLESGTGIGQVLAILYVILTSEHAQTIIIDEPQSFLHPGAVRKLLDILKHYQRHQHQYVITTHSPTAISAADPQVLLLVKKEGAESIVQSLDPAETSDLELLLNEVGARLSDVFGADNILWVEGPTEERCFPLILSKVSERPLLGTKILAVLHTGDFEGKRAKTIFKIYSKLSEGGGLLPPAIGFIFDREKRDEKGRRDLKSRSLDKVVFTQRMMYENYLLDPQAIATIVSSAGSLEEDGGVSVQDVELWLANHKLNSKYYDGRPATEESWVQEVHAAKLLKDLFWDLTNERVSYEKVPHSRQLTEWLLENEPEALRDLAQLIEGILPPIER